MKASDLPAKITVPFAQNAGLAYRRDIPLQSSDAGAASFMLGFPALTFQPTSAGGTPPDGRDMNGILYALSAVARSWCAGITLTFDASFANAVGGYPLGAVLRSATDPTILLISQQDGNMTDPAADHDGTFWRTIGSRDLTNTLDDLTRKMDGFAGRMDGLTGNLDGKINRSGDSMSGPLLSAQGNSFLEISSQNGRPMRMEAFTTVTDKGQPVTFPNSFSGPPVSIIINALEADWDCGAAQGTWTASGFTMSTWSSNTANRPQHVSVMAIGPA